MANRSIICLSIHLVPIRPDGAAWTRTFATEAAAWRVVVGGCNSERERRARQAQMQRAGWRVTVAE